jgi:Uncharacterized protein conserved in bacteria
MKLNSICQSTYSKVKGNNRYQFCIPLNIQHAASANHTSPISPNLPITALQPTLSPERLVVPKSQPSNSTPSSDDVAGLISQPFPLLDFPALASSPLLLRPDAQVKEVQDAAAAKTSTSPYAVIGTLVWDDGNQSLHLTVHLSLRWSSPVSCVTSQLAFPKKSGLAP